MKKILSIFLALCMIVTMLPVSAMAEETHTTIGGSREIVNSAPLTETEKTVTLGTSMEELKLPETLTATVGKAMLRGLISPMGITSYNIWVGGMQVTDTNKNNITGTGITGTVTYDSDTNTLILNGASITANYSDSNGTYGIYAEQNLNIELVGNNRVTAANVSEKGSTAIRITPGSLTISGDGSLTATGGNVSGMTNFASFGISANGLTINSGTVVANAGTVIEFGTLSYGIYSSGTLIFNGGIITATGNNRAMNKGPDLSGYTDVQVTASENVSGMPTVTYNAASITDYKYLKLESAAITNVAQNSDTGTSYATLQAAVDAVEDGQTIRLLSNINLTTTVTVAKGDHKSFALDLNGKTLDGGSNTAITHNGTGVLTIQSSGTVRNNSSLFYTGAINNQGTGSIIVSSGTVQSNGTGIFNQTTGTITVSGGTVSGGTGIFNNSGGFVNISGGTVQSTGGSGRAIYTNEGGNITISGNANVTSANVNTDDGTISLWFSNHLRPITLTIHGGTIENTAGGNAISKRGDSSGELTANISIPNGKSALIKGGGRAMNFAPTLVRATVTASANYDGSAPIIYNAADITNYKYLKFEPGPDTTVTNLNLTSKLTAPATGGTPATAITNDQYTGTITWSDDPMIFRGGTAYTAVVTLTAKDGYTFSGVEQNAFSYNGATSVANSAGSGQTLTVTITFPQTVAKVLQYIVITTAPNKTAYYYGETFDKTGMVVEAAYNDGTADTNFTDYTVDKTSALILSDTTITLMANGTSIKTTQAITVTKKTPAAPDLVYNLTAVDYDGNAKPLSVTAASDKTLGAITVKYNGSTAQPINAGVYAVTVDIAGNDEYNAVTGLSLGNYTINKIAYTGTTAVSASILASGQTGATVALPTLPAGASYGAPTAGGTITMTAMSIAGTTLTYTAPASIVGQIGTMTIPVTGAANYSNYSIVVTVTYTAKALQVISYATATIAKTYGDAKFTNSLTQTTVNGTITYASDDTSVATVNSTTGEVTIIAVGDGSATITATAAETDTYAQAAASYTVTVAKKALTLKADDKSMKKGDGLPTFTYTVTGLVNGDTVTTSPTMSTTTNGTAVGTFDIAISGGVVENAASYDITYTKGALTVVERSFTVTVTNGTGSGNYAEGTTVTITANDTSGYKFTGWSGADVTFADAAARTTTFTMPAKAVTITANYRQNSSGDGGGSSNDDSSPVIVTPPAPDKPNSPTQGEIKVPGTVDSKGNVTVSITDKTVTDAFEKALAEAKKNGTEQNGITVVLRVDAGNKSGSHVTVNLPKTVQDTIIAKKIVNTIVVVDNPDIRVGMDLATVQEINKQAKSDVNITATRTDSGKLTGDVKKTIGSRPVFDLKVNYGKGKQVQNFGTGSVSVTIPYTLASKEKAGNIQAVYVDAKGKVHWLVNSVYDSTEKVLRFSTDHFSTYGIGYKQTDTAFKDITNHWAKEDIEFVVSRGLLSDTSTTAFSPNSAITRGMFVTALGRLANADVSSYTKSSFTDVKSEAYYMGYIEWANKNNIVNGIGNGNFAPDQSITREQMAGIMLNYAKATSFTLPKVYMENTFADSSKISAYAKDAVKQMQMAGVISGKSGNLFDPQGVATRAEASAVLFRFVELTISSENMQGWAQNDAGEWLYYKNGKPLTGTQIIDGIQYFFNINQILKTGWVETGANKRYYSGNRMLTGWQDIGNGTKKKTYYFSSKGNLIFGKWLKISSKWYYFYEDGSLAKSTKIEGYEVGQDGARKTK